MGKPRIFAQNGQERPEVAVPRNRKRLIGGVPDRQLLAIEPALRAESANVRFRILQSRIGLH
jgi:hypothetical protein